MAQYFLQDDSFPLQNMIDSLLKLEEDRVKSKNKLYQHQLLFKRWFDEKYSIERDFQVSDLVLKWDKQHKDKNEYTKFQRFCLWSFIVTENIGPGIVQLQTLEGFSEAYPVNVQILKKYFI